MSKFVVSYFVYASGWGRSHSRWRSSFTQRDNHSDDASRARFLLAVSDLSGVPCWKGHPMLALRANVHMHMDPPCTPVPIYMTRCFGMLESSPQVNFARPRCPQSKQRRPLVCNGRGSPGLSGFEISDATNTSTARHARVPTTRA